MIVNQEPPARRTVIDRWRESAASARRRMFEPRECWVYELLLILLLVNVIHDGYATMVSSSADFYDADAFGPAALGVNPNGWAAFLPESVVTSFAFNRAVAAMAFVSGLAWLFKRGLPWSPLLCVLAHGMQVSLLESRMHNYIHEVLPGVALLIPFAGFYFFRHRAISQALATHRFWTARLYPTWVLWLAMLYLGTQYMYSGITKLAFGGWRAGEGLSLQLLYGKHFIDGVEADLPLLTDWTVNYRPFATLAMTSTVVLETGCLIAFFSRWLRPWWAMGLISMHAVILFTMSIPFKIHIVALAWIIFAGTPMVQRLATRCLAWRPRLHVRYGTGWPRRQIVDLLYALDFGRLLQVRDSRG